MERVRVAAPRFAASCRRRMASTASPVFFARFSASFSSCFRSFASCFSLRSRSFCVSVSLYSRSSRRAPGPSIPLCRLKLSSEISSIVTSTSGRTPTRSAASRLFSTSSRTVVYRLFPGVSKPAMILFSAKNSAGLFCVLLLCRFAGAIPFRAPGPGPFPLPRPPKHLSVVREEGGGGAGRLPPRLRGPGRGPAPLALAGRWGGPAKRRELWSAAARRHLDTCGRSGFR